MDMDWEREMRAWDKAHEKARNPNMTLVGNPLVGISENSVQRKIESINMERLHKDANRRNSQGGSVYAGIMDMRYKGE